jgi:DNA-binding NtrC family response regulator
MRNRGSNAGYKHYKQLIIMDRFEYRENVIHLHLPPLRGRQEDIPLLAQHFLTRYSRELERPVGGFAPEALEALSVHTWPGNVRELENIRK